jgi:hypothetical protein
MKRVVTYQLAYLPGQDVDLCPECAARDDHSLGTLGPVSHGLHEGDCDWCGPCDDEERLEHMAHVMEDYQDRLVRTMGTASLMPSDEDGSWEVYPIGVFGVAVCLLVVAGYSDERVRDMCDAALVDEREKMREIQARAGRKGA